MKPKKGTEVVHTKNTRDTKNTRFGLVYASGGYAKQGFCLLLKSMIQFACIIMDCVTTEGKHNKKMVTSAAGGLYDKIGTARPPEAYTKTPW